MNKKMNLRVLVMAIAFLFILSAAPIKADAAKLDRTSVILLKGKTTSIKLKKYPKKTKKFAWRKSGKAVRIVRKKKSTVKIKAVKNGTSVVKIRSGKKTLKCKVTVIGRNADVNLNKGSGSTLELGERVAKAESSNPEVVKVAKQKTAVKLTALQTGTAKVTVAAVKGPVLKLEVTVPRKALENLEEEVPETPGTEPTVVKPETPGTEPTVTKPENPGNGSGTPGTGVASITDRRTVRIGALYHCNSDQHTYTQFRPSFLALNKTAEEAIAWIDARNEEEKALIEQNINESNYSDEYKAKLLNVLYGEVEFTDEMKAELNTEFEITFSNHFYSATGFSCTASSSNPAVYFYGPWETIPGDEYEEWKKVNKL